MKLSNDHKEFRKFELPAMYTESLSKSRGVGKESGAYRRCFRFNIAKKQSFKDRRRGSMPCHFDDGVIGRRRHGAKSSNADAEDELLHTFWPYSSSSRTACRELRDSDLCAERTVRILLPRATAYVTPNYQLSIGYCSLFMC